MLLSAALLHNPDLILLDEPFSGLDVGTGLVLRSLIQELAARGKVVLFSSHELETVERVCSHVVILHRGKVVADDSIEHLRTLMALPTLEDDLLAARGGAGHRGDLARNRGPDSGMKSQHERNSNSACCIASFSSAWWIWNCSPRTRWAIASKLLGQFASLLIFFSILFSRCVARQVGGQLGCRPRYGCSRPGASSTF